MRTPICKYFCFRRKDEPRNFNNMRAPKYCAARKTPTVSGRAACRGVALKISTFSFVSSKQKVRTFLIVIYNNVLAHFFQVRGEAFDQL